MKCDRCGVKIPKQRLEALPDTRLCVKCSSEVGGDYIVTISEEYADPSGHYTLPQSDIIVTKVPRRIEKLK